MDYDWIEMMNYMQNLRQFCSRNVRRTEKGSISTSQELDLLSRISLSDVPLTPHELCGCMGLGKSAVSRLIEHLVKKNYLQKSQAWQIGEVITSRSQKEGKKHWRRLTTITSHRFTQCGAD